MRYTEPKERSAELLRLTLAHMGKHAAAFNPLTFTLWYEHASGTNPSLSDALNRLAGRSESVDDACVLRLYNEHVAPADSQSVERIGGEMQRLMSSMAHSALQTGDRAGAFGAQLNDLTEALASRDVEQLTPRLSEVLAGTAEMKSSVEALQHKVSVSQDEIQRLRGELERTRGEVLTDPLTGILNRRGFDQKLASLLAEPSAAGPGHCLVMFDIDHFKKVNDTHGHLMGDRVIQAVGEILRTSMSDARHAAARYGGEEFAVLLPATTAEQGARLADVVRTRTKAMKIRNRTTQEVLLTVTLSGGVASLKPGDDAASLISRADAALYRSKQAGRDRVTHA
jgi:diguanylate cyclase